ncbi:hypothetical protein K523DRAFT_257291 [Schizophyllum commune Tattone D]|nr:hypothetical protein K523DRAFT_257291 [Schizophyllum commune Tattone D]
MRSSQFDKVHGESPLSVPRVSMSPSPLGVTPRARSRSPQISTCTLSVKMEEVESGPVEDADRTGHGLSVGMTFEDTPGKMTVRVPLSRVTARITSTFSKVRSDSVPYVPPTAQPLEATASAHEGGCTTASNVFPVKEEDSDTRKTNFVEPEQLGPVAHEHASSKLEVSQYVLSSC